MDARTPTPCWWLVYISTVVLAWILGRIHNLHILEPSRRAAFRMCFVMCPRQPSCQTTFIQARRGVHRHMCWSTGAFSQRSHRAVAAPSTSAPSLLPPPTESTGPVEPRERRAAGDLARQSARPSAASAGQLEEKVPGCLARSELVTIALTTGEHQKLPLFCFHSFF